MIGRGCCIFDPDWRVTVCICILYRSKSPSSRHSISYWVFPVSARACRAAACVSRLSSLSLLNYSELQRDKTCSRWCLTGLPTFSPSSKLMWRLKESSDTVTDLSAKASTLSPKYVFMSSSYSEYWCQGRRQASWSLCPVSGCCLYGLLDPYGQFTGDNIAWVYPDNKTALLGGSELSQ